MKDKRLLAALLALVMVVSTVLSSTGPLVLAGNEAQELPSYNAYDDFSTTENPNGVWAYQTVTNGTYSNIATFDSSLLIWGTNTAGGSFVTAKDDHDQVTGKKAIRLWTDSTSTDVLVSFTAPHSGKIKVSMANGAVFAPKSTSGKGELSFTFKHNDTVVDSVTDLDNSYSHPTDKNRFFADTKELTVSEGDVLRFIVHRNKAVSTPAAYFNPLIEYTEVSEQEELPSYNAYDDFSLVNGNPNGVWKYEYRKPSGTDWTYTDMKTGISSTDRWYSEGWGSTHCQILTTQGGDGITTNWNGTTYKNIQMNFNDQTKQAVLTFIAPTSGTITVDIGNDGYLGSAVTTSGTQSAYFALEHNGNVLTSANVDASTGKTVKIEVKTIEVEAGDVIRFVGGRTKATNTWLRINPTVTYTEVSEQEELPSYNAYDDFSLVNGNPNGVWKYEYRKPSGTDWTYTDMETGISSTDRWYSEGWGSTHCQILTTQGGDGITTDWNGTTYKNIQMNFNDQTKQAVLTFIAPTSGTITVDIGNSGYLGSAVTTSGTQSAYFALEHNGNVLESANVDASTGKTVKIEVKTIEVEAGDVIRFVGGRTKATNTVLRINPTVTYTEVSEQEELPSYNAYEDYSTTENPNGVWNYQHLSGGTYTNMTYDSENGRWGTLLDGLLTTTTSDLVTGQKALSVRPESTSKDVVVTFTAPYSGIISISMANGGVFAPHQNNDECSFTVKHNNAAIKSVSDLDASYNVTDKRFFTDAIMRKVEAGDEIQFIVHRNKVSADPKVYFNPLIEYKELGDDALGFPTDKQIEVSNITTDGFTVEWPEAVGGTGNYSYSVYCSENPIVGTPTEGGISVNGHTYTFTGLVYSKSYYVAVVVDDGEYQMVLHAPEKIELTLDMLSFDAYQDFAKGVQNGVWSYYSTPIGEMKLSELSWNNTKWGNSVIGSVESVKSDLVTGKPALLVKPGNDTDVVVAYTVPYTGTVSVSLANGGIFVPLNGAGDKYDGINFTMLYNQTEKVKYTQVTSKQMHPATVNPKVYTGRVFTESYELNVTKGDVLYFVVNRNTNLHNDDTYFNPSVKYLSIDNSTMDLRFTDKRDISAIDITKSSMTVHWPGALGGTGNYKYTLYISDSPIKSIPSKGGIDMQDKTSYQMKDLPSYTDYYFAVTVNDGNNTESLIRSTAISTIGNTYVYNAIDDYTTGMQPINSPWRYYWKNVETGALNELEWNAEKEQYGSVTTPKLQWADSDMVTGKDALLMSPQDGKEVIIAFIAPFTGKVSIDLTNGGVFAPYNGKPQNYDGINFTLLQNDTTLYNKNAVSSKNSHADRCFANTLSVQVKAGDVLYFVVNANANASEDKTFMAPRVKYTFVNKGSDDFGFLPGATIKATDVGKNSFTLNWSSAFSPKNEEITYKVWISTSVIKKQPSSAPAYKGKDLSSVFKGLKYATKYYAYIVATNESGDTDVLNPTISVQTECPVFDAYLQYPSVTNEAGVWNYAVRTWNSKTDAYEYTLLTKDDQAKYWGTATNGQVGKTDKEPVTGNPSMSLHPGAKNQDAAIVFTAPYSGTIRISMNNGGVFAPHNGKDQGYDGINFFVYHGAKELWNLKEISSKHMAVENRVGTGIIEITVKQGDKIYFVVSANKSNAADSTYFNPYIEYLEVTGGTGVIDKLEGFIIPEPEKVYPASYRTNELYETDGKAITLKDMVKRVSPWVWVLTYANILLLLVIGLVIVQRKIKKKS